MSYVYTRVNDARTSCNERSHGISTDYSSFNYLASADESDAWNISESAHSGICTFFFFYLFSSSVVNRRRNILNDEIKYVTLLAREIF